ncbi:hypothetical protein HPB51_003901 [Rhipicephalus microplus]|uniref:Uncharacterized protein n=1 Tax=Rhipicephalus microplus TaxID=6941 RepID=A0A9J6EXC4_RHIMP|nr:hypothetical protein HPB51_003901 [Rhipicephalus microplus]
MLSPKEGDNADTLEKPDEGYVVLQTGETIPVVNTTSTPTPTAADVGSLLVVRGLLESKAVSVLRDTGCNTVGDAGALGRVNDHAKLAGERGLTGDGHGSLKDIAS